jgi:tetraacyldisaccharide 4'-kinase
LLTGANRILQLLLMPLGWLYGGVMAVRNWLYDRNLKKVYRFSVPVISIGNLTVGGTGKTPHVEYLIRLLKNRYGVATLSRGYGRRTKGFLLANAQATAATLGDEPYQLYLKFAPEVTVAVGERRAEAIPAILQAQPRTGAILLDDAYQHRSVAPRLSILLTDYNRPFYGDFVLPAGRLRESRGGASRADMIIVTKCPPDLSRTSQQEITRRIEQYKRPEVPVFFTGIRYGEPVPFGGAGGAFNPDVVLVSGLANAAPLENYVRQRFRLLEHLEFRDHHRYGPVDLAAMRKALEETSGRTVLTTEKDYVKLIGPELREQAARLPLFYLPIEVFFLEKQPEFDALMGRLAFA